MTEPIATDLTIHRYGTPGAPPMVLLHGLTEAGTTWPDLVAHWGASRELLGVDLRGHGDSPRFTAEQLLNSPEVMLADVVAILDQLKEPVVLVGHSLGGLLALWAALERPDAVRALVLEDPAQPMAGRAPHPAYSAQNEAFIAEMSNPVTRAAKVASMRVESGWSDAEIDAWAACKSSMDLGYIREGFDFDDDAWESRFAALTVPTLLVVPPDTPMAPDLDLVDNPLVAAVVISQSGHCVRRDQPEAFFAAVDAFLARGRG